MIGKFREKKSDKDVFGVEEALAKMSLELLDPSEQKIFTSSDLTPKEIFIISTILSYADEWKCDLIKNWVTYFLLLRISRLRLGRREMMFLGSGLRDMGEKKGGKKISDIFAGLK